MKILEKAFIPLLAVLAMMVSCNVFRPKLATSPIVTETRSTIPTATFTDTPSSFLSTSPPPDISSQVSDKILYYYFVDIAEDVPPEGSIVIMPDVPTASNVPCTIIEM